MFAFRKHDDDLFFSLTFFSRINPTTLPATATIEIFRITIEIANFKHSVLKIPLYLNMEL